MHEEPRRWALEFFFRRGVVPGETEEQKLQVDYFARGLLQSIEVVELILEAEEKFGITFQPEHMQDRRFCIIGGIAEIISEIVQSKQKGA